MKIYVGEIADVECGDVECCVPCKEVRGEIEGVEYYEEYIGCYNCKAKVCSSDDFVGECSKFVMVMKLRRGVKKMAARVIICCEESGVVSSASLVHTHTHTCSYVYICTCTLYIVWNKWFPFSLEKCWHIHVYYRPIHVHVFLLPSS